MLRALLDRRPQQLVLPSGWGEPARRPARRPRLLVLVAAFLVVAAWLTGQLTSARGWLMVALAWLLVVALTGHRDSGGARRLLRMLGEYAAVAVLAVLLVTGTGIAKSALPHSGRTTAGAAQVCPAAVQGVAGSACGFLAKVWRAAKQAKKRAGAPPTTTTGRDSR
jgi:lysylphosphatidylglycerol synthetase-like protein (DUF2156 family)